MTDEPRQKRKYTRRIKPDAQFQAPPTASTAATLQSISAAVPPQKVAVPVQISDPPIEIWDVVQVNEQSSPYFGCLFVVGDSGGGNVHGYLYAHGTKSYITAPSAACIRIGRSFLRSKSPVSPEWIEARRAKP